MDKKPQTIEVLLKEKRTFNPKKDFIEKANIKSRAIYQKAKKDNEKFWETFANELHWFRKWKKTLSWKPPFAQWFIGGKTNVSYNCIDPSGAMPERQRPRNGAGGAEVERQSPPKAGGGACPGRGGPEPPVGAGH